MKKLKFEITINAPIKKVWHSMLDDQTYREWTSAFSAGSFYEGSWEKGSTIRFLAHDENGTFGGMVAMIAENRPCEFVSIKHLGQVKNGVDDTTSPEVLQWAGAFENYTFKENNGVTQLTIEIDVHEEWEDMFNGMWPKALEKLKEISEK